MTTDQSNDEMPKAPKPPLTFDMLVGQQIPRYHLMAHRYQDKTCTMLEHIKRLGQNSWNNFFPRSEMVNNSEGNERLCSQALKDEFDLGVAITIEQIVAAVGEFRSRFKLPLLANNINAQCLNELRNVFMLEEEMVPKPSGKGNHRVYIPVFAILAD